MSFAPSERKPSPSSARTMGCDAHGCAHQIMVAFFLGNSVDCSCIFYCRWLDALKRQQVKWQVSTLLDSSVIGIHEPYLSMAHMFAWKLPPASRDWSFWLPCCSGAKCSMSLFQDVGGACFWWYWMIHNILMFAVREHGGNCIVQQGTRFCSFEILDLMAQIQIWRANLTIYRL